MTTDIGSFVQLVHAAPEPLQDALPIFRFALRSLILPGAPRAVHDLTSVGMLAAQGDF